MRIVCLRSVRNMVERMTIDEVITKYKEITNTNAKCPMYCMRNCDKCVQESGQIAEWLEKLKKYNEKPEGYLWDEAVQQGYNKAIDDFVEKVELKYLGVHPDELYEKYYPSEICKQINDIAEQLKKGMNNE